MAISLGYSSVDHMIAAMTSSQLADLEAMWRIEGGWGWYKMDYHFANLSALLANINRDVKRKSSPYTASDFLLRPVDPIDTNKKVNNGFRGLIEALKLRKAAKAAKKGV